MSPDPASSGSVRSAAELNQMIRALARRTFGRPMTNEERAEYQVLVIAWVKAERGEIVEVA
ncbi:hypothetical protein ACWERY_16425 [Streptomyces sp. NPDC004082]